MKYILAPFAFLFMIPAIFIFLPMMIATSFWVFVFGYIPYVLLGIAYMAGFPYSLIFGRNDLLETLNKVMGGFMGHDGKTYMSDISGEILKKKNNPLLCLYCRIVATYNNQPWHCMERCKCF